MGDTVASSSYFSLQTQVYIALCHLHGWHCGFKFLFQSANTSIYCTLPSPWVTLWLQVPLSVCKHKHILHFAISMGDTVADSSSFSLQTQAYTHTTLSTVFMCCCNGLTYFLLLLHSQLYLWGSPFWARLLHMWPFFNPTIEVVTFRLHG